MDFYKQLHYSIFLKSDYYKYKKFYSKVLDYEYNPNTKNEILMIKKGKTEEDINEVEKLIEENENKKYEQYLNDYSDYYSMI